MQFIDTLPESPVAAKRGRPSLFTPEMQAAVKQNAGKWAVLQENVKGRSRVTSLRKQYTEQGFLFRAVATAKQERTTAKGATVTDEILTVYVSAAPVEVPTEAPAPKARASRKPAAAKA